MDHRVVGSGCKRAPWSLTSNPRLHSLGHPTPLLPASRVANRSNCFSLVLPFLLLSPPLLAFIPTLFCPRNTPTVVGLGGLLSWTNTSADGAHSSLTPGVWSREMAAASESGHAQLWGGAAEGWLAVASGVPSISLTPNTHGPAARFC